MTGSKRISYTSAAVGTALILAGFLAAPQRTVLRLVTCSAEEQAALQHTLGISPAPGHTFNTIVAFFHNIFSTLVGKGIGVAFLSVQLPVLAFVLLYGARHPPGSLPASRLRLAAVSGALWIAAGQAITIGLTLAAFWLPYYARQTANERGLAMALRNPASTGAVSLLLPLSLLVSTGTAVVSTRHPWWPSANVAFQLYPLVFLPLALWPLKESRSGSFNAAGLFKGIGLASTLMWWTGLGLASLDFGPLDVGAIGPVLFDASSPLLSPALVGIATLQNRPTWRLRPTLRREFGDGAFFLVCDGLALLTAMIAVVFVDASRDRQAKTADNRTFLARLALKAALGGPGLAAALYWAERSEKEVAVQNKRTK